MVDNGLASMYPASIWSFLLRAIMDISAPAISLADRPRLGHSGHQYSQAPGRPFPPSLRSLSQTSVGNLLGVVVCYVIIQFLCSIGGRSFAPTLQHLLCSARRPCRDWPARLPCHAPDISRPYLDEVEHDAILKPVRARCLSFLSLRSRGLWRALPRRCARACWQVRSPARCDAGVCWPHQSMTYNP